VRFHPRGRFLRSGLAKAHVRHNGSKSARNSLTQKHHPERAESFASPSKMELSSHFRELRSHSRAITKRFEKQPLRRKSLSVSILTRHKRGWHGRCLIDLRQANQTPTQKPHPTNMSEETNKPEAISDEQLEDVAGGTMDNTITTENCSATLSTINL
jgi:hypothetical protein